MSKEEFNMTGAGYQIPFTATRVEAVPESSKDHGFAHGQPIGWGSAHGAAWREAEKLKPGDCVRINYGNPKTSRASMTCLRSFAYTASVRHGAIYEAKMRSESVYITRIL